MYLPYVTGIEHHGMRGGAARSTSACAGIKGCFLRGSGRHIRRLDEVHDSPRKNCTCPQQRSPNISIAAISSLSVEQRKKRAIPRF